MKYIIKKGNELFEKLTDINNRTKEARRKMKEFCKFRFETEETVTFGDHLLSGRLAGIKFVAKPEGWKSVDPYGEFRNFYWPKETPKNKPLLKEMRELPVVHNEELNNAIGFTPQFIFSAKGRGIAHVQRPGMMCGNEFILISMDPACKYQKQEDMEEITVSYWNKLLDQIQAELA